MTSASSPVADPGRDIPASRVIFMRFAAQMIAAAVTLVVTLELAVGTLVPRDFVAAGLYLAVAFATLYAVHQRRARVGALILVWGTLCSLASAMLLNGGLYATSVPFIFVMVGVAGWLLGRRSLLAVAATSIGLLITVYLLQLSGRLLVVEHSLGRLFMVLLAIVSIVIGLTWYIVESEARANAALKASEEKFRRLAALSADWFWELDEQLRFTSVAGKGLENFELSPGMLIGRRTEELRNAEPLGESGERFRRAREAHEPYRDIEMGVRLSDGSYGYVSISGEPVFADDHTFLGYRGVTRDITKRKRAEFALAASEARFRAVFECSRAGIAIWGRDGRFLEVNQAFCDFVGYAADELVGRMSEADFDQPGDDEVRERMGRMMRGEIAHSLRDRCFRTRDGSMVWGRSSTSAVISRDGKPQYFVAVVIDITEAREAGERIARLNVELEGRVAERTAELRSAVASLEEANRDLDGFNFSVAHDLRQPLNAIGGFSDLLNEEIASQTSEAAREFAREIGANAERMERMVEALLRFSNIGRGALQFVEIDVRGQVESVLRELAQDVPPHVEISVGELPAMRGDDTLLRHVWSNLIGNALKYSGKVAAPKVEIRGARYDRSLVYTVRDNGVGFDMRDAEHIFGVFERLPSAAGFEGTGVGLAIAQRIVRRHGGQISAESAPGQGATFRFTLPA
jgi:PAS domain S-box-containing protein